jgi:hypothetical protein
MPDWKKYSKGDIEQAVVDEPLQIGQHVPSFKPAPGWSHVMDKGAVLTSGKIPWSVKAEEGFREIKRMISRTVQLAVPDLKGAFDGTRPFILYPDMCKYAVGGGLFQKGKFLPGSDEIVMAPIGFYSKALPAAGLNWDTWEGEMWSVKVGIDVFRQIVNGAHVQIVPDHLNNVVINPQNSLKQPAKIMRTLQEIEHTVQAIWMFGPGQANPIGDGFSRNPPNRDKIRSDEAPAGMPGTLREAFDLARSRYCLLDPAQLDAQLGHGGAVPETKPMAKISVNRSLSTRAIGVGRSPADGSSDRGRRPPMSNFLAQWSERTRGPGPVPSHVATASRVRPTSLCHRVSVGVRSLGMRVPCLYLPNHQDVADHFRPDPVDAEPVSLASIAVAAPIFAQPNGTKLWFNSVGPHLTVPAASKIRHQVGDAAIALMRHVNDTKARGLILQGEAWVPFAAASHAIMRAKAFQARRVVGEERAALERAWSQLRYVHLLAPYVHPPQLGYRRLLKVIPELELIPLPADVQAWVSAPINEQSAPDAELS